MVDSVGVTFLSQESFSEAGKGVLVSSDTQDRTLPKFRTYYSVVISGIHFRLIRRTVPEHVTHLAMSCSKLNSHPLQHARRIWYVSNYIKGILHSLPWSAFFGIIVKADSHIAFRAHTVSMPFPCHVVPLIHTCHAEPLPCSDSALSFVKVRVVAGNIRTASPTV
jgi:hypothetical protein